MECFLYMKRKKILCGIGCVCAFLVLVTLYSCGKNNVIPAMVNVTDEKIPPASSQAASSSSSSAASSSSSSNSTKSETLTVTSTVNKSQSQTPSSTQSPKTKSDATGEEENSAAVTPAPTKKPAPTPAPAPAATPVPVPTCSTCGSTDHTVHPQPTPAPTPVPVPTCPTCGSTDHTTHPQPTPIPEDICGFCGGPRSVCGGINYHHYHGNGSDVGDCPVCGFHYDINAGGGYVPPPSEAGEPMPDDLA